MKDPAIMFVLPVEGRRIKDPVTLILLDPNGEWKPCNSYWDRKVKDGDVELDPTATPDEE